MPTPLVKALILTVLIVAQMEFVNTASYYVRNLGFPVELALLIVFGVFFLEILGYRALVKWLFEKYKISRISKKNYAYQKTK